VPTADFLKATGGSASDDERLEELIGAIAADVDDAWLK
jgi:hypothetical protein